MKKLTYFIFLASFIFGACNSSVDSYSKESFGITTKESSVILTNNSNHVVYYILMEYETSTVVDLNPDAEWPTIEANSKVSIPYGEIMGHQESSDEAFIMWGIKSGGIENHQKFKL
ncbi:MAG: hypothetical protein JXR20_00445 [Balneola sp.]